MMAATYVENLQTARDGYARELAQDSANPKPDYSINGQSVTRSSWRQNMARMIKELNELIVAAGGENASEGPYQITSVGCT